MGMPRDNQPPTDNQEDNHTTAPHDHLTIKLAVGQLRHRRQKCDTGVFLKEGCKRLIDRHLCLVVVVVW